MMRAARTKLVLLYCQRVPGSKSRGLPAHSRTRRFGVGGGGPGGDGVVLGGVVGVAAGVREEVAEGDVVGAGEIGVPAGDGVVEGELAILGEEEDAGGGELLGDGADGVVHGGGGGGRGGEAGVAVGGGVDDAAILDDAELGAGDAGLGEDLAGGGVDAGLEAGGELGAGEEGGAGGGESDGDEGGSCERTHAVSIAGRSGFG